MFGRLKKKAEPGLDPNQPIELKTAITINRSADDVYALLDFSDERHQLRARGNIVRRIGTDPDEFRLWYDRAPNLNFLFTVTEAIPGRAYRFYAKILPPVGRRLNQFESYDIEPLGEESCRLTFLNAIQHVPNMTKEEFDEEIGRSTLAMAGSLTKLKVQAEQGVAAVEALERELGQRK
jgi:hypothetical protein